MANKHYDEAKVVKQLARKGINVSSSTKSITFPKNLFSPVGIRSYGKIDFLVNYCGYKFYGTNQNVSVDNSEENKEKIKKEKQQNKVKKVKKEGIGNNKKDKFNLAKQTKEMMKKFKKK